MRGVGLRSRFNNMVIDTLFGILILTSKWRKHVGRLISIWSFKRGKCVFQNLKVISKQRLFESPES